VAFYASTLKEIVARLGGVVTGKRVAARQGNATTGSEQRRSLIASSFFLVGADSSKNNDRPKKR